MKSYSINITVRAENESDLIERLEDETEVNIIDSFDTSSIKEVSE